MVEEVLVPYIGRISLVTSLGWPSVIVVVIVTGQTNSGYDHQKYNHNYQNVYQHMSPFDVTTRLNVGDYP